MTLLDGEPFAHLHAVLSRPSGQALAGYLESAAHFGYQVEVVSPADVGAESAGGPAGGPAAQDVASTAHASAATRVLPRRVGTPRCYLRGKDGG